MKTSAEYQREYRARKKAEMGERYLEKERSRVKKYYTPMSQRSKREQIKAREDNKRRVADYRERKKANDSAYTMNIQKVLYP